MSTRYESHDLAAFDAGEPLDDFDKGEVFDAHEISEIDLAIKLMQRERKAHDLVIKEARLDRMARDGDTGFRPVGRTLGHLSFTGRLAFHPDIKTYAPCPVWTDSTRKDVRFFPLARTPDKSRKVAQKLWTRANDFERRTRLPNRQDGAIGRNGMAVLRVLLFVFINHRTGRLDPGHETIAEVANISDRSVRRGLAKLKLAGIVNWLRRCTVRFVKGCAVIDQDTNAYGILPASQWRGYREEPAAPKPASGTWGDHPCGMRDPHEEACTELRLGGNVAAAIRQLDLETDKNSIAYALAKLGHTAGFAMES
jgi:hypothetical protein